MIRDLEYASKDAPPFLPIHGDRDRLVPAHQAELLHAALEKAGVPVRLHLVTGAGHGVGGREVDELVNAFFDEHLKRRKTREDREAAANSSPPA